MKAVLSAVIVVGLGATGASTIAMARDDRPAPKPAAAANWTGFYLGGGGGYGIANERISAIAATGLRNSGTDSSMRGYFGTISGGYDYQFASRYVAGVFGSYDFSDIRGTETLSFANGTLNPFIGRERLSSSFALGGRLGWLMEPETLLYASGGYSQAHFDGFKLEALGVPGLAGMRTFNSRSPDGWFIGAGTESKLNYVSFLPGNNWYVRAEYRYAEYGASVPTINDPTGVFAGAAPTVTFRPAVQTARTELVYKFNSDAGSSYASYAAASPIYVKAHAPPSSWTGFYVGGGGGYGFANVNTVSTVAGASSEGVNGGARGGFGTVSGGFDYQVTPKVVAGVLANYDFANIMGVQDEIFYNGGIGVGAGTLNLSSSWGVGGRIGWLSTPSTLTYVNGGYTEARFDATNVTNLLTGATIDVLGSHTHRGYFIGSGMESKIDFLPWNNWFLKTEYRYAEYDAQTANFAGGDSNVFKPIVQTVRMELNYRFNFADAYRR